MADTTNSRDKNRALALLVGLLSGVLCHIVTHDKNWLGVLIREAMAGFGILSDDFLNMAVPTGVVFGLLAAIFAVRRLRWRT